MSISRDVVAATRRRHLGGSAPSRGEFNLLRASFSWGGLAWAWCVLAFYFESVVGTGRHAQFADLVAAHHVWTFAGVVGGTLLAVSLVNRSMLAQTVLRQIDRLQGVSAGGYSLKGSAGQILFRRAEWWVCVVLVIAGLTSPDRMYLTTLAVLAVVAGLQAWRIRTSVRKLDLQGQANQIVAQRAAVAVKQGYTVEFGVSAGVTIARGYVAGIPFAHVVTASTTDMCEHTLIMGRSGGGKTLAGILRIVRQIFDATESGAFVISAKRNFTRQIGFLAKMLGHEVAIIGPDDLPYNVGEGVTPAAWGNVMQQAFDLNAGAKGGDVFFTPNSKLRVIHAAGILCGINEETTPKALRDFIFASAVQRASVLENAEAAAEAMAASGDRDMERRADWIYDALDFERGAWAEIESSEKTKAGVLGQINTVLDPLAGRALDRAFGSTTGVDLADTMTGKVIILDINKKQYGDYGASLIALCMFEQFSHLMEGRLEYPAADVRRYRPISFIVDEWGDCVSAQQVKFFRKARESKVAAIMAVQGDETLIQALRGDAAAAKALISLFAQKVTFPVEDIATKERIMKVFAKAEIVKQSVTWAEGESENDGSSSQIMQVGGGSVNRGSGTSKTISEQTTTAMEEVANGLLDGLERANRLDANGREILNERGDKIPYAFQAVFSGYIAGKRMADVLWIPIDEELLAISAM